MWTFNPISVVNTIFSYCDIDRKLARWSHTIFQTTMWLHHHIQLPYVAVADQLEKFPSQLCQSEQRISCSWLNRVNVLWSFTGCGDAENSAEQIESLTSPLVLADILEVLHNLNKYLIFTGPLFEHMAASLSCKTIVVFHNGWSKHLYKCITF